MLLLVCINFEHLLALVHLLLLLNPFLLYVPFHYLPPRLKSSENLHDFLRVYWKKTFERNGLMLPWEVSHKVTKLFNAGFWTLFHLAHTWTLWGCTPSLRTIRTYHFLANPHWHQLMFFKLMFLNTFLWKIPKIKQIEKKEEKDRRNIVSCS